MQKSIWVMTLCLSLFFVSTNLRAELTEAWEISGFSQPESVVYDALTKHYYVSNVAGNPPDKDGNGFISKISREDKKAEVQWVKGLNAPKGLGLYNGRLFVSDIDVVAEIDLKTAQIAKTYPVPGAKFLNDIAISKDGIVYVSDMMANTIHEIKNGTVSLVLQSEALNFPNGLLVEGDFLVIATWGVPTDGFQTKVPGHLKKLNLKTKELKSVGSGESLGNLDGLEPDGKGNYFATDWIAGKLVLIDSLGKAKELLKLNPGSADLTYQPEQGLWVIPMMNDGVLTAYTQVQ